MKRFALLFACVALLVPTAASAYDLSAASWNPAELPVEYRINEASAPTSLGGATARAAIENGLASWSAVSCANFTTTNLGTTSATRGTAGDGQNVMLWISGSWPSELGDVESTIGVTSPVWNPRDGFTIDADIQFNNVGFRWSTTGTGGTVDAQSIATHEEGHFLGLDHSSSSSAVMYFAYTSGLKRTLTADDQAGICAIYPREGTDPPDVEDPCSAGSDSCGDCTPTDGCGWCNSSSMCVSGTSTGPSTGSCASGWTWLPRDCSTVTTPGTAAFGEECDELNDCASRLCIASSSGTSGICSQSCSDDCGCPAGYGCARASGGLRVCAPGENTCEGSMPLPDAGTSSGDAGRSPTDAGSSSEMDSGSEPVDAGTSSGDDAGTSGSTGGGGRSSGCSASGAPSTSGAPLLFSLFVMLALLGWRRRRAQ